ncbi:MAG: cyclic nucleotide-binding domain-containing protein [Acidimicrobiales bacterium]
MSSSDSVKADRLGAVELFRLFDRRHLEELARITDEISVDKGATLCEQGRVATECWIVLEGEAEVEVGDGKLMGVVGPGESIGEMGLLDHLPRSATVIARTPMTLYHIDGKRFDELLGPSPLARALLELLSRRIRQLEHGRQFVS